MSGRERSGALKERLAYEAARIMVEQSLTDFDRARSKAAERTGIRDRRNWPSNDAVREAILVQRRLFLKQAPADEAHALLSHALQAMQLLHAFKPQLVGSALAGLTEPHMGIELFLFADRPEDVLFTLVERQIPWQERERSFRYPGGQRLAHPVFRFVAGEIPFELIVLPLRSRKHPPLDPITDRPQRGADIADVEQMLADGDLDYRLEMGR